MGELVFILGPARSGKSAFAERLAAECGPDVLYVATLEARDDEGRRRAEAHRASRPPAWRTLEAPIEVRESIAAAAPYDACIIDSLTVWLTNLLLSRPATSETPREALLAPARELIEWQASAVAPLTVVSDEVGGGVVPEYALGRAFRDLLGEANQLVAAAADRFYYTVAGHYLDMKRLGGRIDGGPA